MCRFTRPGIVIRGATQSWMASSSIEKLKIERADRSWEVTMKKTSRQTVRRTIVILTALAVAFVPALGLTWGGTGWVTVTMITIYRGSVRTGALVQFSSGTPNLEGCSYNPSAGNVAFVDWSTSENPDGKAIYTTLLAAQLAGRQISIGTNGCTSEGFPLVYAVNVQ